MINETLISIVIPSYNQGAYLKETLDSILAQADPNLEIFIIDGGSTDGTVNWLSQNPHACIRWVSEPDDGQADAINKGLQRIRGEIWAYVNADDPLLPDCLGEVRRAFACPGVFWVGGIGEIFDAQGIRGEIRCQPVLNTKDWLAPWSRPHPYVVPYSGCNFMHRAVIEKIGLFDPTYHYSMDIEYYVRAVLVGGFTPRLIDKPLARWRWHAESKTMKRGMAYAFREDEVRIARRYLPLLSEEQAAALAGELHVQEKSLVPRKAMALHAEFDLRGALGVLLTGLARHPTLLSHRPWWGAMRRVITGSGNAPRPQSRR